MRSLLVSTMGRPYPPSQVEQGIMALSLSLLMSRDRDLGPALRGGSPSLPHGSSRVRPLTLPIGPGICLLWGMIHALAH